jgi:EAL domain-containing protein (putative c-di-GMP-specific phosphodiesterase class I)
MAAEALVRWHHPVRGLVLPADFIPLSERTGMIRRLDHHVLTEACHQARRWHDGLGGDHPLRMHVNLSVDELRDRDLVRDVRAVLEEVRLDPSDLVLEITETQLMGEAAEGADRFHELRELGVRIALDDFGTGYSSLSYLRSLQFDILKIAKPFVDGLTRSGRDASFVAMIVELARTLDLDVIAEGIEMHDQLSALRELGVELGQGYLLGRPSAPVPGRFERRSAVLR